MSPLPAAGKKHPSLKVRIRHNAPLIMSRGRTTAAFLLPLAALVVLQAPVALAQKAPHVPTEEELDKQISGVKADNERGYQQRSVETTQSWFRRAIRWVKELLASIHLTPARLALILGVIGTLYTWGKNKRLVRWMVTAIVSWLLVIVGAAAWYFDWPYWN
jgi:hypothetical protein